MFVNECCVDDILNKSPFVSTRLNVFRIFLQTLVILILNPAPVAWETWFQSQVESYWRLKNWYLMPPCLTPSIIGCESRVKWSNPGKGVASSPTPRCGCYRKWAFWSHSATVDNFTLTLYIQNESYRYNN